MKINIFKTDATVKFGDLREGEVFILDGCVFLKLEEFNPPSGTNFDKFNAVSVATGLVFGVRDDTDVIPPKSVIMNITY